jgi:ketosteroid isomerase-like protein
VNVDELIAREQIRNVMATYNIAGDRGRKEEFASVFTEDAVLETPDLRFEGRDAIVEGLFSRVASTDAGPRRDKASIVRHNLTTSLVRFTGSTTAEGRTYFVVVTDVGADHSGVYIDRFRKEGDRWLIAHREVRLDFVAEDAVFDPGMRERVVARRAARRGRS